MNNKKPDLQIEFLDDLRREQTPVSMYLVNGIRLTGHIDSFDQFAIVIKSNATQMVYKHAISTIVPTSGMSHDHPVTDDSATESPVAAPSARRATPAVTVKRSRLLNKDSH